MIVAQYHWDFFEVNNNSHSLAHMTCIILRFTGLSSAMPSGNAGRDATAHHELSMDAPLHKQKCTRVLISPLLDLLPDVFCLMVRIFRSMLVLLYIYIYIVLIFLQFFFF